MIEFVGSCFDKRLAGNSDGGQPVYTEQRLVNRCCGATIKSHYQDDHVAPIDAKHCLWHKPYLEEKYQFLGIAFFAQPPEYALEQKGAVAVQITLDNGDILTVWEQKECICNV